MKRIAIMLSLCAMALAALTAITAASASAETGIKYLFKFSKGNINEGGKFTATGATEDKLRTEKSEVKCTSSEATGEFSKTVGAHLGITTITFKKCTTKAGIFTVNCGNEGSGENITLKNWEWHLVAGFDPKLGRLIPALLILIPTEKFTFVCAGIVTVEVKGKSITGALYKTGTNEPDGIKTLLSSVDLVFQPEEGSKPPKLLFSRVFLPLSETEDPESIFESNSGSGFEPAAQESRDTISKFENAAKESVTAEIEEG